MLLILTVDYYISIRKVKISPHLEGKCNSEGNLNYWLLGYFKIYFNPFSIGQGRHLTIPAMKEKRRGDKK